MPLRYSYVDHAGREACSRTHGLRPLLPEVAMTTEFAHPLSRREFLLTSGALVVSASVGLGVSAALAQTGTPLPPPQFPAPDQLDSWIAILPDGTAEAFFGKMDMGHGLEVAIAQIVAEELDMSVEHVTVRMGDTATTCNQGGASGSTGISMGAKPLRNAAAEARRVLVERAA